MISKIPTKSRPESAQWLRGSRIKLRLTQKGLADILGVHVQTIIRWEIHGISGIETSREMIKEKINGMIKKGEKNTENEVDLLGRVYKPKQE